MVKQGIKILSDARTVLYKSNIRLHKIVSNDARLTKAFPQSVVAESKSEVCLAYGEFQSTLGIFMEPKHRHARTTI